MGLFTKGRDRRQRESQARGAAMDRFIAEGDAALQECENEARAREANRRPK